MMLRCIIGPATSWRLAKGCCAMDHMLKISFHGCWCPHRTEAKRIAAQLKIIRWLYGTKDYDPRCDGTCRLLLCKCIHRHVHEASTHHLPLKSEPEMASTTSQGRASLAAGAPSLAPPGRLGQPRPTASHANASCSGLPPTLQCTSRPAQLQAR